MDPINFSATNQEILEKLQSFNEEYASPTIPVKLSPNDQQKLLEGILTQLLTFETRRPCFLSALTTVKILSRNKSLTNSVMTSARLDTLLSHAGLLGPESMSSRENKEKRDLNVIEEALRCLSNIYFQSFCAQNYGVENATIPSVIEQIKRYKELELPYEIMSSDIKLIFLITAHRPEARSVVTLHHRGVSRLTDVLRLILTNAKDRSLSNDATACASVTSPALTDEEVTVISDVLKVLFNLTIVGDELNQSRKDEEETSELLELAKLVNIFLTMATVTLAKKSSLVCNCINLLTNYPLDCLEPLRGPLNAEYVGVSEIQLIEFDGACMNAAWTILNYVSSILDSTNRNSGELRDSATPALKVLVCLAKSHRLLRRYLRNHILPPLRGVDLKTRPEEGNTIRNKLCRLLTSPDTSVSTMAAELLFVLCKEKVGRFVKHTGYGNAAGLLARRGLLMGGRGDNDYSSTDEDSDTEEYVEKEHLVNPITGCMDSQVHSNPFAEMSEEQKEYEAVQLANLITKLHNMGVVRPARVDETGRPVEVEHVLQLVEDPDCLIRRRNRNGENQDSDSGEN